jgi:hypothetical protein
MSDADTIELDDHPELAPIVARVVASGRVWRLTRHRKQFALVIPEDPETTDEDPTDASK